MSKTVDQKIILDISRLLTTPIFERFKEKFLTEDFTLRNDILFSYEEMLDMLEQAETYCLGRLFHLEAGRDLFMNYTQNDIDVLENKINLYRDTGIYETNILIQRIKNAVDFSPTYGLLISKSSQVKERKIIFYKQIYREIISFRRYFASSKKEIELTNIKPEQIKNTIGRIIEIIYEEINDSMSNKEMLNLVAAANIEHQCSILKRLSEEKAKKYFGETYGYFSRYVSSPYYCNTKENILFFTRVREIINREFSNSDDQFIIAIEETVSSLNELAIKIQEKMDKNIQNNKWYKLRHRTLEEIRSEIILLSSYISGVRLNSQSKWEYDAEKLAAHGIPSLEEFIRRVEYYKSIEDKKEELILEFKDRASTIMRNIFENIEVLAEKGQVYERIILQYGKPLTIFDSKALDDTKKIFNMRNEKVIFKNRIIKMFLINNESFSNSVPIAITKDKLFLCVVKYDNDPNKKEHEQKVIETVFPIGETIQHIDLNYYKDSQQIHAARIYKLSSEFSDELAGKIVISYIKEMNRILENHQDSQLSIWDRLDLHNLSKKYHGPIEFDKLESIRENQERLNREKKRNVVLDMIQLEELFEDKIKPTAQSETVGLGGDVIDDSGPFFSDDDIPF